MKRIHLALIFGFIFFTGKILAQEQEKAIDNPSVQSLFSLSESIQSGEIGLLINIYYHRKGKSAIETKEYKVIFSKTGEIRKPILMEFNYNILNMKDSIQYVFNGKTWYIINHKKKICTIDTTAYNREDYCLYCFFPPYVYFNPSDVLCNKMFSFYASNNLRGLFTKAVVLADTQKTENIRFLKIEKTYGRKTNKPVSWIIEFEWDINKSTLFRCNETVKDDVEYSKKTIVKRETFLTAASLNDEKHLDTELYNGLNYAKSYKVRYRQFDIINAPF